MFDEPRVREMLEFEVRKKTEEALYSTFRWALVAIGGLAVLVSVGIGAVAIAACVWAVRALLGW